MDQLLGALARLPRVPRAAAALLDQIGSSLESFERLHGSPPTSSMPLGSLCVALIAVSLTLGLTLSAWAGTAVVSNEGSGTLSLIDTRSDEVVGEINAGGKPRGAALSTTTQRIYVSEQNSNGLLIVDLTIFDRTGAWAGAIEGLALKKLSAGQLNPAGAKLDYLYQLQWEPRPALPALVEATRDEHWLLLADHGGVAPAIAEELRRRGAACELIHADDPVSPETTAVARRNTARNKRKSATGGSAKISGSIFFSSASNARSRSLLPEVKARAIPAARASR
jgi:YVTN family beta-propeller protein